MVGKIIQQVAKKGKNLYDKWKQKGQTKADSNKQQTSQKKAVKKEKTAEEKPKATEEQIIEQAREAVNNSEGGERFRAIHIDKPVGYTPNPTPSAGQSTSKSRGMEY